MEIKYIEKSDIINLVEVHKDSFKGFFLTELGDEFLKVYYDCIRKDKKTILLGAFAGDELCGFCASAFISKGFNLNLIINNFFAFFLVGLRLL
ncbi:MAG: GNAT family N-acetyltransferase, partial [Paludibacter sp.]